MLRPRVVHDKEKKMWKADRKLSWHVVTRCGSADGGGRSVSLLVDVESRGRRTEGRRGAERRGFGASELTSPGVRGVSSRGGGLSQGFSSAAEIYDCLFRESRSASLTHLLKSRRHC